ncbi:MAG: trans-2-enoyl-CoA reductase family protein [Ruminococcaceae bacterium]|nr:trans-2-enoyl-CoA reductase family protein [Oscillospiraceae bacterium]
MKIEPKTRGFICTTAHPIGCDENVRQMIKYTLEHKPNCTMPKNVLVIGSSTGYGLASRIAAAFGGGAATVGVAFEKPSVNGRCASAGWYNTAAFDKYASAHGLYSANVMGDAYSEAVKDAVCGIIRRDMGKIDLLIYSLAAPRRTLADGTTVSSTLKPVGASYTGKSVDLRTKALSEVTLEPASEQEIADTVRVMGGEDWQAWVDKLAAEGLLAEGFTTAAYSYIGPALTHAIYKDGTIGHAKAHLKATADKIAAEHGVRALISVNKALVTQSSAAIPVVPLYISILFGEMKKRGTHEGVIEQMVRMMDKLYGGAELDAEGMLRMDDWEMEADLQAHIAGLWETLTDENVSDHADFSEYDREFLRLFGFMTDGVDYEADADPDVPVGHLTTVS